MAMCRQTPQPFYPRPSASSGLYILPTLYYRPTVPLQSFIRMRPESHAVADMHPERPARANLAHQHSPLPHAYSLADCPPPTSPR